MNSDFKLRFCTTCDVPTNSIKGGWLIDGDVTGNLIFLCPFCYKISKRVFELSKTKKYIQYISLPFKVALACVMKEVTNLEINSFTALVFKFALNTDDKTYFGIYKRLLQVIEAGIYDHPYYSTSIQTLAFSVMSGMGLPFKKNTSYYELNKDISCSANYLLFYKRNKRFVEFTFNEKITLSIARKHKCHCCDSTTGDIYRCLKCNIFSLCSQECHNTSEKEHKFVCDEIIDINRKIKSIKNDMIKQLSQ